MKKGQNTTVEIPYGMAQFLDGYIKRNPRFVSRSSLVKFIVNNWIDKQKELDYNFVELLADGKIHEEHEDKEGHLVSKALSEDEFKKWFKDTVPDELKEKLVLSIKKMSKKMKK